MADERLSAAQRSKIRRISSPRELAPDEEGGELNIVPFLDIITNVLMFVLATVTVTFTATLDTFPPKQSTNVRPPTTPTLGLTLLIVNDGVGVKAHGGNIAPGCNDTGAGYAIGKTPDGKDYDWAGLKACVVRLKSASPDFAEETTVTISANNNIPYQSVIAAMDAVGTTADGKELFPDVNFGVAR